MPSRDKKDLDVRLATSYDAACARFKELYPDLAQPFITCIYRSPVEQDLLYAIGRTVPGKKVTNAKGGQSKHNVIPSKAFDIAFITLTKKLDWSAHLFKKFAAIVKSDVIGWGGDFKTFKDGPHFEIK